jgi:hypothetical protein
VRGVRCPPLPEEPTDDTGLTAVEIVVSILNDIGDLPRLMEFYYFWQEPDLFELLTWFSTVPADGREQLIRFLKGAPLGSTVRVEHSDPTTLMLKAEHQLPQQL